VSGPGPRTALVTGASSGIGRAVAVALLVDGWTVIAAGRSRPDIEHAAFEWIETDLRDRAAVRRLSDGIARLDGLVHSAGVQRSAPLGRLDPEAGAEMWHLHVEVPTALVDALVERLSDGGRIVLLGSRTAAGQAGKSQYSASKSALVGLARSWAAELAPRAITVNVVAPGPTDTPMLHDPARSTSPPVVPALGRLVRPEEVAGLTAFLLGDLGGSVTGQHLVMCGGASL
jgi:NAD(P)-dependent dehydrogenase (short-subunit alcohol dehydrogenase family)